jgi:hypothetical protein
MDTDTSLPTDEQEPSSNAPVYASVSSLSLEDGTAPEVGDKVSVTVQGTVHSIEGAVACITPEVVNGEPAPAAPEQPSLRDEARGQMEALDAAPSDEPDEYDSY